MIQNVYRQWQKLSKNQKKQLSFQQGEILPYKVAIKRGSIKTLSKLLRVKNKENLVQITVLKTNYFEQKI